MNYLFKRAITFFLTLFLCVICNSLIFGQAINNQIKDVVMPSPNAASLGKYGDIPVSYNTGVPSIGVPIHTVTEGSISLPISLSYHAGGLKVGEPCSWVGTGFSLQAGGIISRTIQGRPDERENGYFSMGHLVNVSNDGRCVKKGFPYNNPNGNTEEDRVFQAKLGTGELDGEPDIFSFSVGGYNGKFYIGAKSGSASGLGTVAGKVILITKQDVKITYDVVDGFGEKALDKFTMITPDGVKYEFGNVDGVNAIEVSRPFNNYSQRYASSWYLRKITSADSKNVITLNYVPETYQYSARTLAANNTVASPEGGYYQSPVDMFGYRLSTITTPTETVSFVAGAAREDIKHTLELSNPVPTAEIAKVLAAIEIKNGTTTCKRFELSHTYFEDNSPAKSGQHTDKRLKLNAVQEKSCMGTADISLPPHTFSYYGQSNNENYLPNTLSSAVDHWGYYNDATTNPRSGTNMPYTRLKYYFGGTGTLQDVYQGSSNRETNEEAMKLGTIKQITYPTGGNTTFEFEANTYWDSIGEKTLQAVGVIQRLWAEGGGCYTDNTNNAPAAGATFTAVAFTADELNNAIFTMEKKTVPSNISCGIPTSTGYLRVLAYDATTLVQVGTYETTSAASGSLKGAFPALQPNVAYKFSLYGQNFGGQFTVKKEVPILQNINRKIGGLRIKTITNNNGISSANNVVKTYTYDSLNTSTNIFCRDSHATYSATYCFGSIST